MSPIYVPGKVTLAKEFTVQDYMWNFPQQYGLWSPAEITTALWLDAADASTITESGGDVSQWNDKSGNGRHASQATSSAQPLIVSNAYNGLPAVRSDGVDDYLSLTPFGVTAGIRAYGVINPTITTRRNGDWLWMTNYSLTSPHYGGNPSDWYSSFFSNSRPAVALGAVPNNTLQLAFVEQTGTAIKGSIFGHLSETSANAKFNGSPTLKFQVFSTFSTFKAKFDICEIVIVQSPSAIDQEKIEGYLAHKWGLTANLPAGHPYKTVGPTP